MKNTRLFLCLFSILLPLAFTSVSFANLDQVKAFEAENTKARQEQKEECNNNKKFATKRKYSVYCGNAFQHYNSTAYRNNYSRYSAISNGNVRVGEFNVLHPGMGKTRFKDYDYIAKIINELDVVGVTELIPLAGIDYENNQNILRLLDTGDKLIADAQKKIDQLLAKQARIQSSRQLSAKDKRELIIQTMRKEKLIADMKDAPKLYRTPGYLKILDALHDLTGDKTWALLLSPRGEMAEGSPQSELVGYFYRSSVVKPKKNNYCRALACIMELDGRLTGVDARDSISRRPFIGEFISGKFSFILATSHVLFESPKDNTEMKTIVGKAFGVNHYKELKKLALGADKLKYARFAEVKFTMDFIRAYLAQRNNSRKDIIFMGDFNLKSTNQFWQVVMQAWPGAKLYIDDKTSLTKTRYLKNKETLGVASNYDHFIFDPARTSECAKLNDFGVLDFREGRIGDAFKSKYKVRKPNQPRSKTYDKYTDKYNRLINEYVTPYLTGKKVLETVGPIQINYGATRRSSFGIKTDEVEVNRIASYFKSRVLDSQLGNKYYHYWLQQLVSDHFPIYLKCTTN